MEIIEMGKISSRGQVAIPSEIRRQIGLEEGSRVMFMLKEDTVLMRKVSGPTWDEITKPFREAAKKSGLKEKDVVDIIHKYRKSKK